MGIRFRRSFKIAPGVRLNVGKNGVSTSIGPRGATVNIGERGTRGTVGIPGTGLSYSEKLAQTGRSGTSAAGVILLLIAFGVLAAIVF